MQQIAQYRSGERDYTLIKGDTGPLVYPAGKSLRFSYGATEADIFYSSCLHI